MRNDEPHCKAKKVIKDLRNYGDFTKTGGLFRNGAARQPSKGLTARTAFKPPKAKEFDNAARIWRSRG